MGERGLNYDVFGGATPERAPVEGTEPAPLSVTELTARIRRLLEPKFASVRVEGEVSNARPAVSGHVYFNLKDAKASISCVMWAADAARLTQPLRDGDQVEVEGRLAVYEPRGVYQIVASAVRPAGVGKLYQEFLRRKEQLAAEGLFAEERKRPLPEFPRCVGVVTSLQAAALRDILQVLGRRAPFLRVLIFPVRVQGEGAAREIARGIERMNTRDDVDVLIVGRGGGSIEDLWAFNEEAVARAIAASRLPVISAVGHETDFTIADFVADLRAPTPSAAAELVARAGAELQRELLHLRSRAVAALEQRLEGLRQGARLISRLGALMRPRVALARALVSQFLGSRAAHRPLERLNSARQRIDDLMGRGARALREQSRDARSRLARLDAGLTALDPRAVLRRGYSITLDAASGRALRRAEEASAGQRLRILLHKGEIPAVVGDGGGVTRRRQGRRPADSAPDLFDGLMGEEADS